MITIKFKGWFQCRLATDPDPADEKRGISGYMRTLPGEPDFDRIIRFHNPKVERSHTPEVGVFVTSLIQDNRLVSKHPLLGAKVNLEDNPIFFGWNSIIADDGAEPIIPLNISISNKDFYISKKYRNNNYDYPFKETGAQQLIFGANDLLEQIGIYNEVKFIAERIAKLKEDLKIAKNDIEKYKINTRIKWLQAGISNNFFRFRMNYNIRNMSGNLVLKNVEDVINISDKTKWYLNFWMGGWDADAQNGYVSGIIQLDNATLVTKKN